MVLNYDHIKSLVEKKGYSLQSLGTKIELSPEGFRKAIRNETLSLVHAVRISKLLHCDLYELLGVKKYDESNTSTTAKEPSANYNAVVINEIRDLKLAVVKLEDKILKQIKPGRSQKSQS